jgi:hypothetical protein
MDLKSLINYVTMTAAAATLLAVQLLKSKFIPVRFQNYPVPTTIAISAIATFIVLHTQHFMYSWHSVAQAVGTFVTILLSAALTYNSVISHWPAAKSIEAPKQALD